MLADKTGTHRTLMHPGTHADAHTHAPRTHTAAARRLALLGEGHAHMAAPWWLHYSLSLLAGVPSTREGILGSLPLGLTPGWLGGWTHTHGRLLSPSTRAASRWQWLGGGRWCWLRGKHRMPGANLIIITRELSGAQLCYGERRPCQALPWCTTSSRSTRPTYRPINLGGPAKKTAAAGSSSDSRHTAARLSSLQSSSGEGV